MEDESVGVGGVRVLGGVVLGVGAFGAMMVVAPGLTEGLFDLVAFGATEPPAWRGDEARRYERFVHGVLGAVMVGWMLAIGAIVRGPMRSGAPWAWSAVARSLVGWFAVDTAFSLVSGFPGNAALNAVFLAAFAVPLALSRPARLRRARPTA